MSVYIPTGRPASVDLYYQGCFSRGSLDYRKNDQPSVLGCSASCNQQGYNYFFVGQVSYIHKTSKKYIIYDNNSNLIVVMYLNKIIISFLETR